MQRIVSVKQNSIAEEIGILPGEGILSINDQPVIDVIDYEYLTAQENLILKIIDKDGRQYEANIEKDISEPLGLSFENDMLGEMRPCKNHCIFCFIDQMPKGERKTLYVKDDDWRLSFIMGNYITLTNVDENEFQRIINRRVCPLYISVHATDPNVRIKMMGNKDAGNILERLNTLKQNNLWVHTQIVCCPLVNDGEVLDNTLKDLKLLYPCVRSVAVVPVGLTKFRQKLYPLRVFTQNEAKALVSRIDTFGQECKKAYDTSFVFASDEIYILAGMPLPKYEQYEDFPQLENGVGLLRLFEEEFITALEDKRPLKKAAAFDGAGGVLAHGFFKELYKKLLPYNITAHLHAVKNHYFGETVTVGGLVTGGDIIRELKGKLNTGLLLLPHNMLREKEDVFLDGITVDELSNALNVRVIPVRGEGEAWIETLFQLLGDN